MFSLLTSKKTGIKFKNSIKETENFNVLEYGYLYNGGGVSIGDINNDGLSDIYFTGNLVGSRLYINKGDFKFEEIAEKAGVFAAGLWNTGTTMADVNGDGYLDIYVCRSAAKSAEKRKNLLFINNGDLTFSEKASAYGIADTGYSTQGSFFDYDKDGDLDLYVLNHSTQEFAGFEQITSKLKQRKSNDSGDKLYRNDNGKFVNVSDKSGLINNVLGFGLGVAVSDINNDNWLDIYISNDYNEQDYLYINNHDGTFTESLEKYIDHVPLYSMGSDVGDINNDGYTDIMALDMLPESNSRQKMVSGPDNYDKHSLLAKSGFYNQSMRNMLQLNNNGQSFSEIGQFSGVSNTDWSWSPLIADLDNDGYKDLYITNGYKRDYTNMDFINFTVQERLNEKKETNKKEIIEKFLKKIPSTIIENYTYHNNKNLTFNKVNTDWGLNQKSLSNGAAYADLDNDGDIDLVVNNIDQEAFIYRNNSEIHTKNHHLKIKLKGNTKNTFGIGSKVELYVNNQTLTQELIPSRGYQSSGDFKLVFGLGNQTVIPKIKITWPNSKVQILENIKADQTITLHQKEATLSQNNVSKTDNHYFFTDVSKDSVFSFSHKENDFVDYRRELLLPHKLSTQGPKITKGDVNNDGLEDIFIGGAKGNAGKLYLQQNTGNFYSSSTTIFSIDKMSEDIGVLFFDADNDKDLDLYVVSGGSDFNIDSPELQDRLYINNGKGQFKKGQNSLPKMLTSGSSVTAGDFDKDGDLDLFIGGRLVPGSYPTTPRSYLLENDSKGNFKDITSKVNPALTHLGMVTDAIWSDYNADGSLDLLVVGEWMNIRIFNNLNGKLSEITETCGTKNSQGWWNKIVSADIDNDGDLDYIIGNFGQNSQLKASITEPVSLYAKDFDKNGAIDPILCSYNLGESYPVFSKDDLLGQLNYLKSKYVSYAAYSKQKITDIFTKEELSDALILKAVNFNTSYLENLGNNTFKLSSLPNSVQFSPIYGIVANDFNNDGNTDLVLGGNFLGSRVKYGSYDANKGNFLIGDGKGKFVPTTNLVNGLNSHGEVRDIITIKSKNSDYLLFIKNNTNAQIFKINIE